MLVIDTCLAYIEVIEYELIIISLNVLLQCMEEQGSFHTCLTHIHYNIYIQVYGHMTCLLHGSFNKIHVFVEVEGFIVLTSKCKYRVRCHFMAILEDMNGTLSFPIGA